MFEAVYWIKIVYTRITTNLTYQNKIFSRLPFRLVTNLRKIAYFKLIKAAGTKNSKVLCSSAALIAIMKPLSKTKNFINDKIIDGNTAESK